MALLGFAEDVVRHGQTNKLSQDRGSKLFGSALRYLFRKLIIGNGALEGNALGNFQVTDCLDRDVRENLHRSPHQRYPSLQVGGQNLHPLPEPSLLHQVRQLGHVTLLSAL